MTWVSIHTAQARGYTSRLRLAACLLSLAVLAACRSPAGPGEGRDEAEGGTIRAKIGQVQGLGERSTYLGQRVSVEGVVVGNFSQGLGGIFIQSETPDDQPQSSEGLFVEYRADAEPKLRVGDKLRATGIVSETGRGEATITGLSDAMVEVIGRGEVAPTVVGAPASAADWERYEGMLLRIDAPLAVTGNEGISRYGEISVSFGGRLYQPSEQAAPGDAARKVAADNARRRLLLDDARNAQDPKNLWFLPEGLTDASPLRAGSVLRGVTGLLDQRHGRYRLQLSEKLLLVEQAPRPAAPTVPGDLRVAALNLLNLFNGDGAGGGYPTERGAETAEQQRIQVAKHVAVVQALAPDVAALMEVENDGFGPDSALAQFVAALNQAGPIRDYRFVDAGEGPGRDGIRVAMIYRGSRITPQGKPATIATGPFERRSRAPLAQAFRAGKGPVFVAVANHFKSKGCGRDESAASGAEADQGDGQGCWNPTRVATAKALQAWLDADPTGSGSDLQMILGDLNAYGQEDPIRLLREAGWQDAFADAGNGRPYSYVFEGQAGRLDHALLSPPLARRLRGAAEWHNNADEAEAFSYERDAEGDPWRASDHDPLLLGFDLRK
jgi:hypothetical protein